MKYPAFIKKGISRGIYKIIGSPVRQILDEEMERPGSLRKVYDLLYTIYSREHLDRPRVLELRNSSSYKKPFIAKEPLVSICVPTYCKSKILMERTLPNLLNQSYKNIEVILVGDRCIDDTEDVVKKIKDKRFHFYNLPYRGVYPSDPENRWRVAGSLPFNEAIQRSKGLWIAHSNDDDEFLPNHIEVLLKKAQKEQLELVYGKALSINTKTGKKIETGSFPPGHGSFTFYSSIYHSGLKFFEYDINAWVVGEPADWNLCRRMVLSGVRMGFLDQVVTKAYYNPKDRPFLEKKTKS